MSRRLKCDPFQAWVDCPHIYQTTTDKITDARILKVQAEFLGQGVCLVRELYSRDAATRLFVVPTSDTFEAIGAFGTHGINMGMEPDLVIAWLMSLYQRHPVGWVGGCHTRPCCAQVSDLALVPTAGLPRSSLSSQREKLGAFTGPRPAAFPRHGLPGCPGG